MRKDCFITCALTGAGGNVHKSPNVPFTPEAIATDALEAAEAGAAVVHIHVRDPQTREGSRDVDLYQDVVERIRASGSDVIINLTGGMGGDLLLGDDDPLAYGPGTDLVSQRVRLAHVEALRPEICTLDCGTFNFGPGNFLYVSSNAMILEGARSIRALGVKPELEVFELGHLNVVRDLVAAGEFEDPPLIQLCMGVPGAAPATMEVLAAMRSLVPEGAVWSGFGVGAMQMPMVAAVAASGGNVRVGLEDNIYLRKGVFATNAQLVQGAKTMVEAMGITVLSSDDARRKIGLAPRQASA
jgi:uncharacterized protein (DUF849 family)